MKARSEAEPHGEASRRDRLRAELERDAKAEARRLTAVHGIEGLSLSAVARSIGVTPPALYRYFDGKKGLALAVYEDLTVELVAAVAEAAEREAHRHLGAQLYAASRAVLDWSVANPAEFDLLMGSGYSRLAASVEAMDTVLTRELGSLFATLFAQLWRQGNLEYPADEEIEPALVRHITAYRRLMGQGSDFPLGVALLMITCWRQIYGLLCMAVYSHFATAFDDYLPLFNRMLDELLGMLGLVRYPVQG
ncbi:MULTISPECIES: TetR/AcrR family transcriptional regulator [Streptomyces]|uniref:TetR/AcrR family transcriptional regulator n=1 Tax=Streptomyces TaxID=1883 RepID=UPI00068B5613|nr:TetR/AcrR family transcriptional regulator [Streptomyces sp. NRRL F-5635]